MNDNRFIVFVRCDRHPWAPEIYHSRLSVAVISADAAVANGNADRAVVMEISGTDAMPMFTYRYGAKR